MVGVAFLSLILTIIVQDIRLRSAAVEHQRARARLARVDPEAAWAEAIEDSHRFWSSPTESAGMDRSGNGLRAASNESPTRRLPLGLPLALLVAVVAHR